MRLQNKYKKFNKLSVIFNEFPARLLKFHRTKWQKIQQLILKKKSKIAFWGTKNLLYTKRWHFYKSRYSFGVQQKKYFDCIFDKAFSSLFFKNLKYLNKKLNRILEYAVYMVRPEFRLDLFLYRLNFFSSCYEARQAINNKSIKLNNSTASPNYFLKKGDVVFFSSEIYHSNKSFTNLLKKKLNNNKILTFVELDYYTNTFVILKNYNELNEKDMIFFISNSVNVAQYKLFIQ